MTVTALEEAAPHATVTQDRDGRRYQCPYNVTVSSDRDSGDTIIDHLQSIGKGINSTLRYGDMENNLVFCENIAPTRKDRSLREWLVVLTYAPPETDEPDNQPGPDGQPTDEPLDWAYEVDSGTQLIQVPVWQAWNEDQFPLGGSGDGYVRAVGTLGPVVNSAGIVLDPPLMTEVPETWWRISGVVDQFNDGHVNGVAGYLNDRTLTFSSTFRSRYNVVQNLYGQWSIKCTGAAARKFIKNGYNYWRHEYEFRYRPRDLLGDSIWDGWLLRVLDRGLTRWAGPGADDGFGGAFSLAGDDHKDGMADLAAIKGPLGESVGELVLLDGHGSPLVTSDSKPEGVYFRWRVNPQIGLHLLPLDIFEPY